MLYMEKLNRKQRRQSVRRLYPVVQSSTSYYYRYGIRLPLEAKGGFIIKDKETGESIRMIARGKWCKSVVFYN